MSITSNSDFMAAVRTTIRDAGKLKQVMLKKGITAARAPCPECDWLGREGSNLRMPESKSRI